ncbi:MAG: 30S ribosomal protein S6, partial [Proteobacteria bacterium]|nr:30S ribosomal protein S6 [Pseudomonadota bacterium]
MQRYETLLLLSPELEEEKRNEIFTLLASVIERESGTLIEQDEKNWGMKTLAYPVENQSRGYYTLLTYTGPGPLVAELERIIRITDGINK